MPWSPNKKEENKLTVLQERTKERLPKTLKMRQKQKQRKDVISALPESVGKQDSNAMTARSICVENFQSSAAEIAHDC